MNDNNKNNIDRLDDSDVVHQMTELASILGEYAYHYYVLDKPIVSDKEYDVLYDRLTTLESQSGTVLPSSPTRRIGGEILKGFDKHTHKSKLYSLDKVQSIAELLAWFDRTHRAINVDAMYSLEYKMDGLTICLTYDNGVLVSAATRGNGTEGEDITSQVLSIKTIPLNIAYKGMVEVQGEGIIHLSDLDKYNQIANKHNKTVTSIKDRIEIIKNARNGVAGSIRNLDPKVTAQRGVDIYFYNINYIDNPDIIGSQRQVFEFLDSNKFKTAPSWFFDSPASIADAIRNIDKSRLDFLIDGMVVKIDEYKYREELGYTIKFPKWAVAYKFDAQEVTTTVLDVRWQVGRTGKLTPLAILEPVEIGGATVARATLNNYDDIMRKDVGVGSTVFVRRSNDVIPEIISGVRGSAKSPIDLPSKCPACGGAVRQDGVHYFCVADNCSRTAIAQIEHFASKDCMDIDSINSKTIELLYNLGLVTKSYQLYALTKSTLVGMQIKGLGDKKIDNMISAIHKSKGASLDRFVHALGIAGVGKKTAKDLSEHFASVRAIGSASIQDLVAIPDIGDTIAQNIVAWFADSDNMQAIDVFEGYGISPVRIRIEGVLSNTKFVITGTLSRPRAEFASIIVSHGGTVGDSVSKDTTYLLAGDNAGSKLDRATKLGVRVINETELEAMIDKV